MSVDLKGLVQHGHLDLHKIFRDAEWKVVEKITSYMMLLCDDLKRVDVVLETAEVHGITAYVWVEKRPSIDLVSRIHLDRKEAFDEGLERAFEHDHLTNIDYFLKRIFNTRYFGDATIEEIRSICDEATRRDHGYLILPAGKFVGNPVGLAWSKTGVSTVNIKHVVLPVPLTDQRTAAKTLLHLIREEIEAES